MKKRFAQMISLKRIFLFLSVLFFWSILCFAEDTITLQWDANTEPDNVKYKLYYKVSDTGGPAYNGTGIKMGGKTYSSPIDVGTSTKAVLVLPEISNGKSYYFAVTAYDSTSVLPESGYSNEKKYTPAVADTSTDDDQDGASSYEEMGPNGDNALYDGNKDGIADSQQNNVVSLHMSDGEYLTFEIVFIYYDVARDARLEVIKNPDTKTIVSYSPDGFNGKSPNYSGGIFSFIAECEDSASWICNSGRFQPEVRIYYHKALPKLSSGQNEVAVWCDGSDQCYDFEYSEETGVGMVFPNRDGLDSVTVIKLKDGELGDSDGTVNGRIVY